MKFRMAALKGLIFFVLLVLLAPCGRGLGPGEGTNLPDDDPGARSVTSVSPLTGGRGTELTITGAGFESSSRVTVGGVACHTPVLVSPTSLTCLLGGHHAGLADLQVTWGDGRDLTLANAFTYRSFLYTGNPAASNVIGAYELGTNGIPTALSPEVYPCGGLPEGLALDPNGKFLYVAERSANRIEVFPIDPLTGALGTAQFTVLNPEQPSGIAMHPSGDFLVVSQVAPGPPSMIGYTVNRTTGQITYVGAVGESVGARNVVMTPDGRHAFALSSAAGGTLEAAILSPPGLSAHPSSPFSGPGSGISLAVESTGKFLFAADGNAHELHSYSISESGVLALVDPETVSPSAGEITLAVHPTARFVYLARANANQGHYFLWNESTGDLSPGIATFSPGGTNFGMTFDPQGRFLYATNALANEIWVFAVDPSTGVPTLVDQTAVADTPHLVIVD